MFCIYCGIELPEHAKFCFQCGKAVAVRKEEAEKRAIEEQAQECCEIIYVPVAEKKGLFPKEKGRFEAVIMKAGDKPLTIAKSDVFDLGGFQLYGPAEKNKHHAEALAKLADGLYLAGWRQDGKRGPFWYSLRFRRNS